ncbi:MAG: hypothetical protein FWE62_05105 [Firmicutes bacterium]|nr:hypothetical protein [Bacillota bacterium]
MFSDKDKNIVRGLAARYAELAADSSNAERRTRGLDTNGLRPCRPPVRIEEIPWHEMDIDGQLKCLCENDFARGMEWFFRSVLFRWKYFRADMTVDNFYRIGKCYDNTGYGISVAEDKLVSDAANHIYSHGYKDQLDSEDKLGLIKEPVITAHPDRDEVNAGLASELLGGILPVRLTGTYIYLPLWDYISMWRGVEPVLNDICENPGLLHKTMRRLTDCATSMVEQMEAQGLLDYDIANLHCTPHDADELPAEDRQGGPVRLKDVWFRGTAQMFSSVSPAMHDEFEIQYIKPLAERCGLTYYGCCEPLHDRIDMLKQIKNLRKIGVSPWADVNRSAERIGREYVFARKPNPAFVAGNFDAAIVRKETEETILACKRYGCPYEFVLKDISTVSYKPQNIIEWNKTVQETIDQYY